MMNLDIIYFLLAFPAVSALALLFVKKSAIRDFIVRLSAAVIIAAVALLAWQSRGGALPALFQSPYFTNYALVFWAEAAMTVAILYLCVKYKQWLAFALALVQMGFVVWFEHMGGEVTVASPLYIDKLSLIMAGIIGVIGSLICVYALGYMKHFHRHYPMMADRRPYFFFLLFLFLSAMFGIVFSNDMYFMLFFWEITTLCSFLLIGYTRTQEAVRNSFRALVMNMSGGIAFVIALIYMRHALNTCALDKLIEFKELAIIPAALLCYAALTKAAQMPFSSWLLGAMVAPTPTSALLHSSTMVKAGVFLALKMSPIIQNTYAGNALAVVGGATFLACSLINIAEHNVKKLLAYSTVANLGLIVCCAGIGSPETVWIGIMLIIFHAVSKSLLFLVAGTVENRLYTKDIENYDNLIVKMPVLSILLITGVAGMFVAPFGVVISKWAAIKAFLAVPSLLGPVLIIVLAFGSGATLFYWTKLLGKVMAVKDVPELEKKKQDTIGLDEWIPQWAQALLSVAVCLFLYPISVRLVDPYVAGVFGSVQSVMSVGNYIIIAIMVSMIVLLPLAAIVFRGKRVYNPANTYMSGRTMDKDMVVDCAMGSKRAVTLRGYYFEDMFGEHKIALYANTFCAAAISFMIIAEAVWGK